MKIKWFAALCLCLGVAAAVPTVAMAAEGRWIQNDGGWQYERPNGSMARNTWEDIDGEWYHFGDDSLMQTGWQKIGNIRFDLTSSGALAVGWRYYNEGDCWYYFDETGNAKIGWLYEEKEDCWYWFNPNGIMNTDTARDIKGERYYFYEDGKMRANEYRGFRYVDDEGHFKEECDIRAVDKKDKKTSVDSDEKDEIGEEINSLPRNWRKYFLENGWRFLYCPEKEYYTSARFADTNDRYYIRYRLDTYNKTLRFTELDAIKMGFGEYIYYAAKLNSKSSGFSDEADWSVEELRDLTELPEYYDKDYRTVFGALFARYMDDTYQEDLMENFPDLYKIVDDTVKNR